MSESELSSLLVDDMTPEHRSWYVHRQGAGCNVPILALELAFSSSQPHLSPKYTRNMGILSAHSVELGTLSGPNSLVSIRASTEVQANYLCDLGSMLMAKGNGRSPCVPLPCAYNQRIIVILRLADVAS